MADKLHTLVQTAKRRTYRPPAAGAGLDVLVVDDEQNVCDLLRDALARYGHRVVSFTDGHRAIEEAQRQSFDVVFLDIRMPGINGVEVLKTLHRLLPQATFVMITAYAESELVDESLDSGAFICLSKPLSILEVVELVQGFGHK